MQEILSLASEAAWGPVTISLLSGTGLLATILTRGIQFRSFFYAWKLISGRFDNPEDAGEVTHFQALSAALSATIGTGNIAGVGTAIALGGPGAIFWMWVTAVLGMGLKYSECLLSLKFRVVHSDSTVSAGPMYYLERGLGRRWLGLLFAFFAVIASFGIGNMVQANSVASPLKASFGVPKIVTGLLIGFFVFLVIVGGIKRIGMVASRLVPVMSIFYVAGAGIVLVICHKDIPQAFFSIFHDAFSGSAAAGGFAGAAFSQAIRFGVARGIFSNEAGLGSAPIAHGAAKTSEPVREGLVAMLGPFIDTIVICTMTALVILVSDGYKEGLTGAELTAFSFNKALPGIGGYIVSVGIIFFAFSTAVSWSYYGDRSVEYIWGRKLVMPYRILYCLLLPVGACLKLEIVWTISDITNALMVWPNLVGILFLMPVVIKSTNEYFKDAKRVYKNGSSQNPVDRV